MKNTISTDLLIKAYMTPAEMISREILWENHQIEEGVRKYREAMEDKSIEDTTGGQRLIKKAMENTIAAIHEAYKVPEALLIPSFKQLSIKEKLSLSKDEMVKYRAGLKAFKATPKGNREDNWVYMIGLVSPEQSSVIALNMMLSHCQNVSEDVRGITQLAKRIGNGLRKQMMFENWKANEKAVQQEHNANCVEGKERPKSYAQMLIERARGQVTRPVLARWERKFESYTTIEWGEDTLNIGMKMIDLVSTSNPELFDYKEKMLQGKTQRILTMTETAWLQYEQTEDMAELQRPFLLPTLITPKPFGYVDGEIVGGYHHIESPLFSRGTNAHTSGDKKAPSQEFLDSINQVQSTAWKINPFILAVADMVYGTGATTGGVTQNCNATLPSMNTESYEAMSKEARRDYHTKRNSIVTEIASKRGKHSAFTRKIAIAHKMAVHAEFYYPHFADFRGRLYPMPAELTPQGDQVAKGLLMFAKGKKLGASGLKWLMIHAANCYEMDKSSLAEREQWAWANLNLLAEVSSNPITDTRWVIYDKNGDVSNDAFSFLAAAKEITEALNCVNPSEFMSHLPVAQDGTCNGMQILSMLGRDQVGATATNCTAKDTRLDLYLEVGASVLSILKAQAVSCLVSKEWVSRLDGHPSAMRSVVKRACMTKCYGVTDKGISNQLISDKKCTNFASATSLDASLVMTNAILEALNAVSGKAMQIMKYFQSVAVVLAKQGLPLTWRTPMGLKVTRGYYKSAEQRIRTILGRVTLKIEDEKLGLNPSKQALSSSPNVIHSLDAAMLQMTVSKLSAKGLEDFAMIHDSYGIHACDTDTLHAALRSSALDIFSGDVLGDFHAYAQSQTSVVLPTPPELGDYDINEITNAPYFFS